MINKTKKFFIDNSIYNRNILVGLSGGPDSVSLLFLINQVKDEFNLKVSAAYVNHGIRNYNENEKDRKLVKCHCENLGIKLNVYDIPQNEILTISKESNRSTEAVAREYRYNFFNKILVKDGLIALGHNKDDQLETMIMRFFQGSSIEGLSGIDSYNGNVIRPLHNTTKIEILSFLKDNNIAYNIDSSNLENDYLRNKVRNILIPVISDIFPGFTKSLNKLEDDFRSYELIINNLFPPLQWNKIESNGYFVEFDSFIKLPFLMRKKEIYNLYDKVLKNVIKDFRLPSRFLAPLRTVNFQSKIILDGYGYRLYKNREKLCFAPIALNRSFYIEISKNGCYKNSTYEFIINNDGKGSYISGLSFPFTVRSPILGYKEIKKLKNIGINQKEYDKISIIEKDSEVKAILNKSKLIYQKKSNETGIYIIIK